MNENESPNTFRPLSDPGELHPGARWLGQRASCVLPKLCESRKPWPIRRAFAEHLYRAAQWPQACPSWAAFALPAKSEVELPACAMLHSTPPMLAGPKMGGRVQAPTATPD